MPRGEFEELFPVNWVDYAGKAMLDLPPLREFFPPAPARMLQDIGLPTLNRMPTPATLYQKIPKPTQIVPQLPMPPAPPISGPLFPDLSGVPY